MLAVMGLSSLGVVLLLSGVVGGVVLPGAFYLGFYSLAVIGTGLLGVTSLLYVELVRKRERLAGEKERESLQVHSLIQTRLSTTSKEIRDELSQKQPTCNNNA